MCEVNPEQYRKAAIDADQRASEFESAATALRERAERLRKVAETQETREREPALAGI